LLYINFNCNVKFHVGRAMVQAISHRPPTSEARFRTQVGFVAEKVALKLVFLQGLRVSPVSIISPYRHEQ
jgi:hypothetical protein